MDGVAFAVWQILPWRTAGVSMDSAASATFFPVAAVAAPASMDAAAYVFRNIDATVTIDASADATVTPVYISTAKATMDGAADTAGEVAGISVAEVVASMDAAASVSIAGFATAPASMNGIAFGASIPATSATAGASMDGAPSVTTVVQHAFPSRVVKSSPNFPYPQNTWTRVTGWELAAGSLGQAGVNGLVVTGSGTVDVSVSLRIISTSTLSRSVRVTLNDVALGDNVEFPGSTTVLTRTVNAVAVNPGDVLSVWIVTATSISSQRFVMPGADTFINITEP
ncbi:hypothetical protein GS854_25245 [Rhodococcus hoagii]|nr:hypothetical protein [Prescottella equi]NKT91735.1 hypothetical protein [Prescottella equi]NKT96342.1 hypothetical protein [Prescottella equi]